MKQKSYRNKQAVNKHVARCYSKHRVKRLALVDFHHAAVSRIMKREVSHL